MEAVKQNITIDRVSFNKPFVDTLPDFDAFVKEYEKVVYCDANCKPIDTDIQMQKLKAAWAILRPEPAKAPVTETPVIEFWQRQDLIAEDIAGLSKEDKKKREEYLKLLKAENK